MPTPPGGTSPVAPRLALAVPPLDTGANPVDPVRQAVTERPHDVGEVVVELGRSVLDEHDLLELLQRVVDVASRTISGVDSAGVTAHLHGRAFTAVHTDATTLEVDAHQYEADEGPCLQAMRTGQVVRVDVATSRELWPEFTADAEAAGIHSFLAAPLGAQHRLGALNLYSHSPDGFDTPDEAFLAVLTGHATRAIEDYVRLSAAELLAVQLREAMASRAPIEQAKGILMAVHGIDDDAAFERLRTESQHSNTRLHEVAVAFVKAHTTR